MAFTNSRIKSIRKPKKRKIIWEGGTGLGIRVSPAGLKTFIFMYRHNRVARMMSLGNYPSMSLADARLKLAEAKKKLENNIDPAKESVERKRKELNAETIGDLAEEYLEKYARPNKRSVKEDERILRVDIIPVWGRHKAKSITKRDVITLLDRIIERGSPIAANRTFALIRKMFNFAISRDILQTNPCFCLKSPSKENQRDRVLTEDEIKSFWNGLNKAKMSEGSKLALKLQMVTAQRKGEILTAKWSEFVIKRKVWTIPVENAKNGLSNTVPLSSLALKLLKKIKIQSKGSRWLFPSRSSKDKHVAATGVDNALRRNLDILKIKDFVPHDLRRTTATYMSSMGTSRLVISKILNHAEQSITAIYDRHSYDKEKRKALDAWGRKLESILRV